MHFLNTQIRRTAISCNSVSSYVLGCCNALLHRHAYLFFHSLCAKIPMLWHTQKYTLHFKWRKRNIHPRDIRLTNWSYRSTYLLRKKIEITVASPAAMTTSAWTLKFWSCSLVTCRQSSLTMLTGETWSVASLLQSTSRELQLQLFDNELAVELPQTDTQEHTFTISL